MSDSSTHVSAGNASQKSSSKRYHHGDLRNALLDAATHVIQNEGIAALSLRRIADEAQVSRTAPYRHFANKEALLAGLATLGFNQLRDDILQACVGLEDDPEAMFFAGCHAYTQRGVAYPCLYRLMFGHGWQDSASDELTVASQGAFQPLLDCIIGMQSSHLLKAADPVEQATTVWAAMHGIVHLWIDGKANRFNEADLPTRLDVILTTLLNGLKAQPERA